MTTTSSKNGIERLEGLFPDLPRSALIKADTIRKGIRYTPNLLTIGKWAVPQVHYIFEWDHQDLHSKNDVVEGWVTVPGVFQLGDGTTTILKLDNTSPYEIRSEGDARYRLYSDDEPIDEVYFEPRPEWFGKRTKDGTLMCKVVSSPGRNCILSLTLLGHCEYFNTGDQCAFCCLVPSTDKFRELGIEKGMRTKADQVLEVYEAIAEEHSVGHINITGGGLRDTKKEAELYVKFLTEVMDGLGPNNQVPWLVIPQALDGDSQKRIHEAGRGKIFLCHPIEVWNEKQFEVMVPGKAKYVGRKNWTDALVRAVGIFGRGRVLTNIVGGMEMAPPHGFKTYAEGMKSTVDYFEWCFQRDIVPSYLFWTSAPGAVYEEIPPPPTEYMLSATVEFLKLQKKYRMPFPRCICHKCRAVCVESDIMRLVPEYRLLDDGTSLYSYC